MPMNQKAFAAALKTDGKHSDGRNLYLYVRGASASFIFRKMVRGVQIERSLGTYPAIDLLTAREKRDAALADFRAGKDPFAEDGAPEGEGKVYTFGQLAEMEFERRRGELKRGGEDGRWWSPVKTHLLPSLSDRDITTITQHDLYEAVRNVWGPKNGAGDKALSRAKAILELAESMDLPVSAHTVVKARKRLPKLTDPTNIAAMPYRETPAFFQGLGGGRSELALRLLILTASRSAPVRLARVGEFDLDAAVWSVPADHMKNSAPFRVALSDEAVAVVREALQFVNADDPDALLLPGNNGRPLSDMTMTKYMRDRDLSARPHGFRSSFRDWAAEHEWPEDISEIALAHAFGNAVQRAYRRSDLLERRRPLMQAWADHLLDRSFAEAAE